MDRQNIRENILNGLRISGRVKPCPFCGTAPHWVADAITCTNIDYCPSVATTPARGDGDDHNVVERTVVLWNRRV